jgi:hypothetical protein
VSPAPRDARADQGDALRVRAVADARVRAEIAEADALVGEGLVRCGGDQYAVVMLVKGRAGPAEHAGGEAISGPDGRAAASALKALGFDAQSVFRVLSRSLERDDSAEAAKRLRWLIEAVDPVVVVALDTAASQDCARAMGTEPLVAGNVRVSRGRRLLYVDGLEGSLADPALKRRVWSQFKGLRG